jgi:hypothetical protein
MTLARVLKMLSKLEAKIRTKELWMWGAQFPVENV